jgi:hypothetical protein
MSECVIACSLRLHGTISIQAKVCHVWDIRPLNLPVQAGLSCLSNSRSSRRRTRRCVGENLGENLLGAAAGSATWDLFLRCVIKGGYVNSKSLPDLPNNDALLVRLPVAAVGLAVIASRIVDKRRGLCLPTEPSAIRSHCRWISVRWEIVSKPRPRNAQFSRNGLAGDDHPGTSLSPPCLASPDFAAPTLRRHRRCLLFPRGRAAPARQKVRPLSAALWPRREANSVLKL